MSPDKINGLDCILLIDDDDSTNFVHRKVIEFTNIHTDVQITTSGIEALEYLTCTGKYAGNKNYAQSGIIFLDINMPGMDGWDFLEEYKQLNENQKARIVVVMVTSSINPADKERAETNKDVISFLNKPLTVESVQKVVADYFYV